MSLIYARYPERKPIERAVKLIMSRQLPVSTCIAVPNHIDDLQHFRARLPGWILGCGSYGRDLQQELHHNVSQLQVQLCDMGSWEGP